MIETIWIIIPNLIASYMVMVNKAFYANMIYCFGYLLFIWHNYNSGDSSQMIYFTILEIMSIIGVFLYLYSTRKTVNINETKNSDNWWTKIRELDPLKQG
jgi:di/tricarboxylate transporter